MKIVFFTNAYTPIINGIVTTIHSYYQQLLNEGHQVQIFAPAYKGWHDHDPNIHRFPAVNLSTQIYFPIAIPLFYNVHPLLKRFQPDIIHNHHPFILGKVGLQQAKQLQIPSVYTFHTQYEQYSHYFPMPQKFVRWAGKKMIHNYTRQVDLLLAPAESIVSKLKEYDVQREIEVLPNPVNFELYQNLDRTSIRTQYNLGDCKLLLTVGRLGKEKNLEFMLQSFFILLRKSSMDLRLMIVGAGPEERFLRDYAENLGMIDRVIFTGMVNPEQIPHYYAAADLFLMTSTTETFGLVMIEALASGLPVIAVKANGSQDLIHHGVNGLLTIEDAEKFAEAIQTLLEDQALHHKISKKAREFANHYSIKNLTNQLIMFYEEEIDKKKLLINSRPIFTYGAKV